MTGIALFDTPHGAVATKRRLLEIEGALAIDTLPLFREANHGI